jgi:hypothetical protein
MNSVITIRTNAGPIHFCKQCKEFVPENYMLRGREVIPYCEVCAPLPEGEVKKKTPSIRDYGTSTNTPRHGTRSFFVRGQRYVCSVCYDDFKDYQEYFTHTPKCRPKESKAYVCQEHLCQTLATENPCGVCRFFYCVKHMHRISDIPDLNVCEDCFVESFGDAGGGTPIPNIH